RPCSQLSEATVLATTHWSSSEQRGARHADRIEAVVRLARLYRTWGDGFGYFAVAPGGADLMLDPVLSHWDVAAVVPVVEAAGGGGRRGDGGGPPHETVSDPAPGR